MDNHFYGGVYSVKYTTKKVNVILGGGYNEYVGDHFGEIIWAQYASNSEIRDKYYDNVGKKTDFNSYLKSEFSVNNKMNGFIDLQVRSITYSNVGTDNDLRDLDVDTSFVFFNPKFGLSFEVLSLIFKRYAPKKYTTTVKNNNRDLVSKFAAKIVPSKIPEITKIP